MVAQVSIQEGIAINQMTWSCEKFKMDDTDEERTNESPAEDKTYSLAVSFIDGTIYIMRNYDDIFPIIIRSGLLQIKIEWSNNGEILAIAGHQIANSIIGPNGDRVFTYRNIVKFYTFSGILRLMTEIDCKQYPITAITWGHSDKRLFTAVGPILYIAWISKRIPSLHLLSRLSVFQQLTSEKLTDELPLPPRLQTSVANLFSPTLQCYLPDLTQLRDFVSKPPQNNTRLHCTMIRHDEDLLTSSTTYILYLEYLGGLVPILKGKRASKLKPEFIIYDPQSNIQSNSNSSSYGQTNGTTSGSNNTTPYTTASSDSEADEPYGRSPQPRRRRRFRRRFRSRSNESSNTSLSSTGSNGCVKYVDDMPEQNKLLLITSNIWGTKFKILSLCSWLPSTLGSINYKTSLLHLQPRQMTLSIKELGEKRFVSSLMSISKLETNNNNNNNNNQMSSDSEDEMAISCMMDNDMSAPIAPMTPKKEIRANGSSLLSQTRTISPEKRAAFHLNSSGQQPSLDYANCAEELLTLLINGDSHHVEMSASTLPGPTHPPPMKSVASCSLQNQSTSISTQTSFQSITELLNSLTLEKNTQTLFSPVIENKSLEEQTEETFSRIAKLFAAELPQSYYGLNGGKCMESLHSPLITNDLHLQHKTSSFAHTIDSPNVSPPKGMRYKIVKKESPRKASVSCIETDLTPSPKSQRRYPITSSIVTSGPSGSSWGGVSMLHCNGSLGDTISIEQKSLVSNDLKYIDDFDAEESGDNRSSTLFQKNRSICQMQPSFGTEFTNVRTGSDAAVGHTFPSSHTLQRRLTLKASKQSHSFDISSDNPNQSSEKCANNSRSFEEREDEEEEDSDYSKTDSFFKCKTQRERSDSHSVNKDGSSIHSHQHNSNQSQTTVQSSTSQMTLSESPSIPNAKNWCPMPTNESSSVITNPKKTSFKCDSIDMVGGNQRERDRDRGTRKTLQASQSRKQDSDVSVGTSHVSGSQCSPQKSRLQSHRGSLPQAIASTSIQSLASTTSATNTGLANRSLPASPLLSRQQPKRRASMGKSLLYSPMMLKKVMKQK